jgi:hypothetical protein
VVAAMAERVLAPGSDLPSGDEENAPRDGAML